MTEFLPSWADGAVKAAVLNFVEDASRPGSGRFVATADRIAAFDNDGTIWVEQPIPVQGPFLLEKLIAQVRANPSLTAEHPYSAIINRDESFLRALAMQIPEAIESFLVGVGRAWEGTTPEVYEAEVRDYLRTHTHPRWGRPATDLVYRPMLELFDLLRAHDWRIYVCSGGGRDFMRVIAEQTWGIGKENVIGSAPEYAYRDSRLVREAVLRGSVALGPGKPEHIYARTGRLPALACGNGDVDLEMLEVSAFPLVIVHDDDVREYAYTDAAERLLERATRSGWTTVSIKNDWSRVFKEGVQ